MTEEDIVKQHLPLRALVLEHAKTQTALPTPRKTRLAIEALGVSIKALKNPALFDEWEETYILLYCHRRLKPARIHGRLKRMEKRYVKQGQEDRFIAFFECVKQTLHPDFITPHGYNRTFGEMASSDIFSKLDIAMAPVIELGKPVILYAGALLGHVREGQLIDHDDDVDFALYLGDSTLEDVPEQWANYQKKLLENKCLDTEKVKRSSPIFKVTNDLGIDIDLFPAWTENGRFSVYPYSLNDLPENEIFQLKSLNGGQLKLPQNPHALLAQSYGENWRVPDPLFHFGWPFARRKFSPLLQHDFSIR